jgi:cytochrome b561
MGWRNSAEGWGRMARLLHWLTALIIVSLLTVGFVMTRLDPSPQTIKIYTAHKSFGLLLLAIVIVRILWRGIDRRPPELPMPAWQRWLASGVHFGLYGLLIAMPITGWLMHSASGYPLRWFFVGPRVPSLIDKDSSAKHFFEDWHEGLAWALIAVLILHVAGALKHHFLDRDRTLMRMWKGN